LLCGLFVVALSLAGLAHAQAIEVHNTLISKGLPSDTGNGSSSTAALSSADGRYVVFTSLGANFVPGIVDANSTTDVFLHDRATQKTVLVSRSVVSATTTASGDSRATAISADGEWVLFWSRATDLAAGVTGTNLSDNIFLYQRSTGTVTLVSRSAASATTAANGNSTPAAISADGRWVLFASFAANIVPGVIDGNRTDDAFLARIADPNQVFANGFESLIPGTIAPPDGP
jgi:Tol biopolymer transport system component